MRENRLQHMFLMPLFFSQNSCIRPSEAETWELTEANMDLTCFNTSGPFAQNASLLYDANNDEENLWERNGSASLPQCSEHYRFLYQCLVCQLLDLVYVVCNNLTDGVNVILEGFKLEGVSDHIKTVISDCPRVQIAEDSKGRIGASSGELGAAAITGIVSAIILILAAIILAAVFLYRRHQRSRRGRNSSTTPGPSSSHEGNGLQLAEEKLLTTDNNNTANGSSSPSVLCGDQSVCGTRVQQEGNGLLQPADEPLPV